MQVTFSKLKKYIEEQGGYDLSEQDNDGSVSLSFVPSFPEALEKSYGDSTPRVVMHGTLKNGILTFDSVQVEQGEKTLVKDRETAELTYKSWIAFIEENY